MPGSDVLLVSLASTGGWRAADAELAGALERAGASVSMATAQPPAEVRTFALTDLGWARAARRATREALREKRPRAVLYSTATAALLWPEPGAIRFDALAAGNRTGRHGTWQRPLERRRLERATLLIPCSEGALAETELTPSTASVVVPIPVEPSGSPGGDRDIAAITYAANPTKKGLDRVLAAWSLARRPGEELVVCGTTAAVRDEGVHGAGVLAPQDYRALLRRARVFVTAPRREDYGIAQLEALVDGCVLVTTEGSGPYPARELARELDARFVGDDLAGALRAALDEPAEDYFERALELVEPFRRASVDRTVAERLVPALLD